MGFEIGVWRFGVEGWGCRVRYLEVGLRGLGLRVWGLRFVFWGLMVGVLSLGVSLGLGWGWEESRV